MLWGVFIVGFIVFLRENPNKQLPCPLRRGAEGKKMTTTTTRKETQRIAYDCYIPEQLLERIQAHNQKEANGKNRWTTTGLLQFAVTEKLGVSPQQFFNNAQESVISKYLETPQVVTQESKRGQLRNLNAEYDQHAAKVDLLVVSDDPERMEKITTLHGLMMEIELKRRSIQNL